MGKLTMSTKSKKVRFSQALNNAKEVLSRHRDVLKPPVIVVRDLYGRIRVALEAEPTDKQVAEELHRALGGYSPGPDNVFLDKKDMFQPSAVFKSPDRIKLTGDWLFLLDQQLTGQDWLRRPVFRDTNDIKRATLFSIKGGVGRSTALAVWSWHLADQGKKVLVVDMDLESPGLGTTLLPQEKFPDFGVVDWLVEDAVKQADENLLRDMVATSPLSGDRGGEILVVPACGTDLESYITKLSRAYLEVGRLEEPFSFACRIDSMLRELERSEKPDVVLIDSRAGIHDIAAATVTRLNALVFLFAVESPQTWYAYRMLFQHWLLQHPSLEPFRNNLKMVAAMVPKTNVADYLERFKESSYDLWSENLYEETTEDRAECFNFDLNALEAPHFPLRIDWDERFQEFNPLEHPEVLSPIHIEACYGNFLHEATSLVTGEEPR